MGREAALAIIAAAALAGCERIDRHSAGGEAVGGWSPSAAESVQGVPVEALRSAITTRLGAARPEGVDDEQWAHAKKLYKVFGDSALWLDENGVRKDRGEPLVRALLSAQDDALDLDAYPVDAIVSALDSVRNAKQPTAAQLADADVLLTAAFVSLGEDLLTGQISPKSVSQDWHISPRDERVDSSLVRMLRIEQVDSSMTQMRPSDPDYAALRKELVRMRAEVAKGPWPTVPAGKPVKPGQADSPERLSALRARLAAEGLVDSSATVATSDTTPKPATSDDALPRKSASRAATPSRAAAPGAVYDRALAGGVATFQARHGIVVDSILGKETVDALNVPNTFRLGQIAANLERYRWMPRAFGQRYVLVNVPAFRLRAYEDGKPPLEMKVIVGADYEDKKTPVFSDSMETVVFRPYWNVTDSIAAKEIWPKAQADPDYLARNNYETYQENGKTRIRQKPGPKNSLGLVKFLFPNDFNIYLHDTPDDQLFDKDVRAFSHGCIRVEKPAELAQWVLGWPADKVQQAMQSGPDNHAVKLPSKIPVYIAYFTTYVKDGQLYYGNDLYGRDQELVEKMTDAAQPTQSAQQKAEALRRYLGE